jgi:putative sigma-54 modulation protein
MDVTVQSKNLKTTESLRNFLGRQVEKLANHRYPVERVTAFIETVRRKKNDMMASLVRLQITVPGKVVVVERRGADVYDTITDVTDRADRVLRKSKERAKSRKHLKQG